MAGDDDGIAVAGHHGADGSGSARVAGEVGQFAVGARFPRGNAAAAVDDLLLERAEVGLLQRDIAKRDTAVPRRIGLQALDKLLNELRQVVSGFASCEERAAMAAASELCPMEIRVTAQGRHARAIAPSSVVKAQHASISRPFCEPAALFPVSLTSPLRTPFAVNVAILTPPMGIPNSQPDPL